MIWNEARRRRQLGASVISLFSIDRAAWDHVSIFGQHLRLRHGTISSSRPWNNNGSFSTGTALRNRERPQIGVPMSFLGWSVIALSRFLTTLKFNTVYYLRPAKT